MLAERGEHEALRRELEKAGASAAQLTAFRDRSKIKRTALHAAVSRSDYLTAEVLLDHGADVGAANRMGNTALHLAAVQNDERLCRMLCGKTSTREVNHRNNAKAAPLIEAAARGDDCAGVVAVLVEHGAELEAVDDQGRTALLWACCASAPQMLQALIDAGASIHAVDSDGASGLHHAATFGLDDIARTLIAAGADVNLRDAKGKSPLALAMEESCASTAAVLTASGALP